jgi:hypothetical protein
MKSGKADLKHPKTGWDIIYTIGSVKHFLQSLAFSFFPKNTEFQRDLSRVRETSGNCRRSCNSGQNAFESSDESRHPLG